MTFDAALADLMPSTVQVAAPTTRDAYGKPQAFGADVAVQCRVEQGPQMIRGVDGREVVSTARVYTAGPVDVPLASRITLPDGTQPEILRVELQNDEDGPHHTVVYV